MTSIEFHRRVSSRGVGGMGSLYVRVIHRRKTRSVTLPFRLYPNEWDPEKRLILHEGSSLLRQDYLRRAEAAMVEAIHQFWLIIERLEEKGEYSAEDIVSRYRGRMDGGAIVPFVDKLCREMESQEQVSSVRSYKTALRRLESFLGKDGMTFSRITPLNMERFEKALYAEGLSRNTVSSYMRSLRAIFNKAIAHGIIEEKGTSPFACVFTGVEETRKRSLTRMELQQLVNWELYHTEENGKKDEGNTENEEGNKESSSLSKMFRARQLFTFAFFAQGMSFVDMAYLKKRDVKEDVICYRRRKTGQYIEVTLTPQLRKIIQEFGDEVQDSPYVLPIICRPGENERLQYESALRLQNKWLGRLAAHLKIENGELRMKEKETKKNNMYEPIKNNSSFSILQSSLSTHVARHSWATIAKQQHLPIGVISECLGHTSEKTTRIYLGAFDRKIIANANRKIARLIS